MKSKIWIGVDHDNQPIIRINWNDSEDVRDKQHQGKHTRKHHD